MYTRTYVCIVYMLKLYFSLDKKRGRVAGGGNFYWAYFPILTAISPFTTSIFNSALPPPLPSFSSLASPFLSLMPSVLKILVLPVVEDGGDGGGGEAGRQGWG